MSGEFGGADDAGEVPSSRVQLLGAVRVWRGGVELPVGGPLQRATLALLALADGRLVGRAELVAALWGDASPASAEGSL
jgi:DNA-binding SARP family transcriptional activator